MKRRSQLHSQQGYGSTGFAQGNSIPALPNGSAHIGFILLAILLLFLSVLMPQKVSGLRMHASDIMAPALQTVTKPIADAAEIMRNVSGLAGLQSENIRLQQENTKLKEWYQTAMLLKAENESLRGLLNVKTEPQYKTITARVVADSGSAFARSLLLSAGARDGVAKGQAVMSAQGLIGRVIEVGDNTARVLLISDINSRVPVLAENSSAHAVLSGLNKASMQLNYVPPGTTISKGERIVTSGHGGLFPPGLPIGRVNQNAQIGELQQGQTQQIIVEPFADFSRITHVRIIDKANEGVLPAHAGL